jgi:hypothetical protein
MVFMIAARSWQSLPCINSRGPCCPLTIPPPASIVIAELSQTFIEKYLTCSPPMQALGSRLGSAGSLLQKVCRFSAGVIADQGLLHSPISAL